MNEKELFEQAAARAEKINKTCKDYELARTSLEALQQDNAVLHITVESIDKAEEKRFTLASLARSSELAIIDHLKGLYSQRIDKCKEIVSEYVQAEKELEKQRTIMTVADSYANAIKRRAEETQKESEAEKPITAAVKVSNERIEQLRSEGLSATQIAKVTGMKPNTVTHRIRYNEDRIDRKSKNEKPDPTPRVLSKDIISDTELEEQYYFAAPRLTELCKRGIVEPCGKKKCIYTGKTVAAYKLRQQEKKNEH